MQQELRNARGAELLALSVVYLDGYAFERLFIHIWVRVESTVAQSAEGESS